MLLSLRSALSVRRVRYITRELRVGLQRVHWGGLKAPQRVLGKQLLIILREGSVAANVFV